MDDKRGPTIIKADENIENANHLIPDYKDDDVFILDRVKDLSTSQTLQIPLNLIILCIKGKMQMDVNGKSVLLSKDEVLMCPPNVIVSDQLFSMDFECKILGITDSILQSFLRNNVTIWNQAIYISKVNVLHTDEEAITFFNYLYELLRIEMKNPKNHFRREMIHSLISCILLGICNALTYEKSENIMSESPRKDIIFRHFLQILGNNKVKRHSVEYYAQELHITSKYLSIVCKRSSGKTALDWIDNYVLEDIRFYLRNTDLSIKEISNMLGFPNLSFFGKYIRRHFNMSPKEYRKTLRR